MTSDSEHRELVEGKHGFGRIVEVSGDSATVEYFDHPGEDGTIRKEERLAGISPAFLPPQTRVHWRHDGQWDHGRVIDHLADEKRVVVRASGRRELELRESVLVIRWRRRLGDATAFLADGWVESRRFYDARQAFVPEYLDRAAAYQGITALASSAIEIHPHQVEAVRRVITDVSPRYLLADEVGLGKTIEAGLLIRQHLLDRRDSRVLATVPDALVSQWSDELDHKFHIGEQFPERLRIVGHSEVVDRADGALPTLLVVDEAHRLTRSDDEMFRALRDVAIRARGVLLLSATPLLEESTSMLRMLHLLSPEVYSLDELGDFKHALSSRDEIASLFGNLAEDTPPLFLRSAVEGLRQVLGEDRVLSGLLDEVEAALDGDGTAVENAVRRARSHVTEVHRIHNRMIRTRRDVGLAEEFPVLGRVPPTVIRLQDALVEVAPSFTAWHEWVLSRAESVETKQEKLQLASSVLPVVQALSSSGSGLADAVDGRLAGGDLIQVDQEESELLGALAKSALSRAEACPRIDAAVDRAVEARKSGARVAVVSGTEATADVLQTLLDGRLGETVLRISAKSPFSATEFNEAKGGAVLVFGPVGEEGQNLQAADVVIHLDLPWDPNRLEQRLGRFDRFGAGAPCEHFVFQDDVDSPANAWFDLLSEGFEIFSGSIASLQQAIERLRNRLETTIALDVPAALRGLVDEVSSELEQELGAVELGELLDETVLDEKGRQLLEDIDVAEGSMETSRWCDAVVHWASGSTPSSAHLRFSHFVDGGEHSFRLTPYENPIVSDLRDTDLPLVPWTDLSERFAGSMSNAKAVGSFKRNIATHRHLRLFGPGDPFIDALWDFTEVDDRGRSFALWRARSFWTREEALVMCFDIRIRPDIRGAIESSGQSKADVAASLRRRIEGYLSPIVKRVWLTPNGKQIENETFLKLLESPYSPHSGDRTLRPSMWDLIDVHVPRDRWSEWCREKQQTAQTLVRENSDLENRCREAADRAGADVESQIARLLARGDHAGSAEIEREQAIGQALVDGLRRPTYEVDAAGLIVLSDKRLSQDLEA